MNIRARIFARKIALVYLYQRLFVQDAHKKQIGFDQITKIGKAIEFEEDTAWMDGLATYYDDIDQEIAYLVKNHFAKLKEDEIDFDYLKKVLPYFDEMLPWVRDQVNVRAKTFKFDQMDVMDRVIFVLGMIEYKEIGTPKEVVINEMVELAKRYGDESSPKLINGIAHYLFEEQEKGDLMDMVTGRSSK